MTPYLESAVGFPCKIVETSNYTYGSMHDPWHMSVTVSIDGDTTVIPHVYCGSMLSTCNSLKIGTFRQCFMYDHRVKLVDMDVMSHRFSMLTLALIIMLYFVM